MHCAKHLDALLYALHVPASSKKRTYTHCDPNANSYSYSYRYPNPDDDSCNKSDLDSDSYGYANSYSNGDVHTYRNAYTKSVRGSQLHRH